MTAIALVSTTESDADNVMIQLEMAKSALATIARVDEVKSVCDKVEALRICLKKAGYGLEAQNSAAEIRIRYERRGGELLSAMNLRGGDRKSNGHDVRLKLSDIGVTEKQSTRWQKLAAIPEEAFESHIRETIKSEKELTTAGTMRVVVSEKPEHDWTLDEALDALTTRIEFCAERWPLEHRKMFRLHLKHAARDADSLMERIHGAS